MRARVMAQVYRQYWRVNVLTTLEYRENFLLWFGFTFVYHATAIGALWTLLAIVPSVSPFFSAVGDIPDHVREGEFDRFLIRPLDPLFQAITTPGQIFPDELILALATFVAATIYSGVAVTLTFIVFVPLIWIGGALIDLGFNLGISTAAFWFIRVDTLRWIVLQLEQEFTRYPLSIYTRGVRLFLTFVFPFAFMNYLPAAYFLHKTDIGLNVNPAIGLLTPLIGIVFASAAYVFWRFGLDKYQGVGH